MDTDFVEKRLVDLETRVTFQERIIDELSEIIRKQQEQLDLVVQKFIDLSRQIQSNLAPDDPNYKPPHY